MSDNCCDFPTQAKLEKTGVDCHKVLLFPVGRYFMTILLPSALF